MKTIIAAISCWLLKKDLSIMDAIYATLVALTINENGFWSPEILIAVIVIFSFHFLFCRLTANIRIKYMIKKMAILCSKWNKPNGN